MVFFMFLDVLDIFYFTDYASVDKMKPYAHLQVAANMPSSAADSSSVTPLNNYSVNSLKDHEGKIELLHVNIFGKKSSIVFKKIEVKRAKNK